MGRIATIGLFAVTLALGCTKTEPPPPDALHQLYIELEQSHTRSMERFGFSMEYAAEPPDTIAIILRYDPMTEKGMQGKEVAEKARIFVRNLAAKKYGISDLQVRSENIRLTPQ